MLKFTSKFNRIMKPIQNQYAVDLTLIIIKIDCKTGCWNELKWKNTIWTVASSCLHVQLTRQDCFDLSILKGHLSGFLCNIKTQAQLTTSKPSETISATSTALRNPLEIWIIITTRKRSKNSQNQSQASPAFFASPPLFARQQTQSSSIHRIANKMHVNTNVT